MHIFFRISLGLSPLIGEKDSPLDRVSISPSCLRGFMLRVRVRVRVMVRVGVNHYPNPNPNHNHNQSEDSHSNQSEARIPDLPYKKIYYVQDSYLYRIATSIG